MTKKRFAVISILLLITLSVFAQNILVERYLNAANDNLAKREYKKAFDYINYVLSQYSSDKVPQNVIMLAEDVYYSYLVEIRDTRDMEAFAVVKDKLLEFEYLSTEKISRLVKVLNTIESQNIQYGENITETPRSTTAQSQQMSTQQAQANAKLNAEYKKHLESIETMLKALEQQQKQSLEDGGKQNEAEIRALEEQKKIFEAALKANQKMSAQTMKQNNSLLMIIVGATIALIVVVILIVIMMSAANAKANKKQQVAFEATLEMVSRMAVATSGAAPIGIDDGNGNSDENLRSVGSSRIGSVALPQAELSEKEKADVSEIAAKCRKLGEEIDEVTGRKNNSKNVAELVYKIANELRVSDFDASIYFCAGLVYDAGFLMIGKDIFSTNGQLTEEQKAQIRDHVKLGVEKIDFVPMRYYQIFEDAMLMHHENMDGTGYPHGASGEAIPLIGRIIRVADAYNAMTSRRNFRGSIDKETAIKELLASPNVFDSKVVEALDSAI